ncbi:CPBP family intramembrane glutamic endopeptidase [Sphingobacterium thalpophilum]|uniref:CPBP family intramembrane glutamic endopeptidase n=1 Tax=Sphingobacterium thalpophilum TaxID=259 RepID=A0ABV4HEA3_9SPHI
MKLNPSIKIFIIVFLSFLAYYLLFKSFQPIKSSLDRITHQGLASYILTYLIVGIPIFTGTFLLDRKTGILGSLGLSKNIFSGLWRAVVFTLPMFFGGLICFKFNTAVEPENLIAGTLIAGFMEELYFRGFLFGQLFKETNWGFIPSIFLGALIFASGHLYQSKDFNQLIGIFMITFFGAVFFAWLYVEWNYNLWVPIWTHTFMNLSWMLFEVDKSALGDLKANIFRGLTIITAIVFTVVYKKSKGQKLTVDRQTLMLKRKN